MPDCERRLAAIMFTDIVGYTSLTQKDESSALQALEKHRSLLRPLFTSHGGREIKTVGDAFLVEFQSALDAVLCAVAVQQMMHDRKVARGEQLSLRIGIHVGDVIESGSDILGDAVNIASRFYPLAEPGGVCISEEVQRQVGNKLDLPLLSLGEKSLKNVSSPVEVYKVVMPWEQQSTTKEGVFLPRDRIAVLPFANMSPDPNDEYFADGLTEELIGRLSLLSGVEVISRTSTMAYKKKEKTASQIGSELRVGTLLEGSVRKAGNRIRVTAQLIDATTEGHLWMENYDRNLEDIFAVQSEVAEKVASSLQLKLTTQDQKRLVKGGTSNMEAYAHYLKGRFYDQKWDESSLSAAISHYEHAISLDSDFALAYCGLSNVHVKLSVQNFEEPELAAKKCEEAARKALELDESLAEAHMCLAQAVLTQYDSAGHIPIKKGKEEIQRALELNPNLVETHILLANHYGLGRRWADCLKEVEKMLELDPLSVRTSGAAGFWYLYAGQYDKAIEQLNNSLELDPSNTVYLDCLGLAHIQKGMVEEGLAEVKKAGANYGHLAYALVKAKRSEEARKLLKRLEASKEHRPVPSTEIAGIHAVLGESAKALECLEMAHSEHLLALETVYSDFIFDSLHDEPRFQTLLERIGFFEV
jgi:TolB-like protein/class 3 adenylate cyclase